MALTLRLNRTGRAGATDLRDMRDYVRDREEEFRKRALDFEEVTAMRRCIELEGDDSFVTWFDDDNNVPIEGPIQERIALIGARIEQLEAEARYTVVDHLVGEECSDIQKIADTAELIDLEDNHG